MFHVRRAGGRWGGDAFPWRSPAAVDLAFGYEFRSRMSAPILAFLSPSRLAPCSASTGSRILGERVRRGRGDMCLRPNIRKVLPGLDLGQLRRAFVHFERRSGARWARIPERSARRWRRLAPVPISSGVVWSSRLQLLGDVGQARSVLELFLDPAVRSASAALRFSTISLPAISSRAWGERCAPAVLARFASTRTRY